MKSIGWWLIFVLGIWCVDDEKAEWPLYEYWDATITSHNIMAMASWLMQTYVWDPSFTWGKRYYMTTVREIGMCPANHLDVYTFGCPETGDSNGLLYPFAYRIGPETRSWRWSGYLYSAMPMVYEGVSGFGYCPYGPIDWTNPMRYGTASMAALINARMRNVSGISGGAINMIDWYKNITDNRTKPPPPLREFGKDGFPVKRLFLMIDYAGVDWEGSVNTTLPRCAHNCLMHEEHEYVRVERHALGCYEMVNIDYNATDVEDELNAAVCPYIERYRELIDFGLPKIQPPVVKSKPGAPIHPALIKHVAKWQRSLPLPPVTFNKLKSSIGLAEKFFTAHSSHGELRAEQEDGGLSRFAEQVDDIIHQLKDNGFTIQSPRQPPAEIQHACPSAADLGLPTLEEISEVIDYIQPHYMNLMIKNMRILNLTQDLIKKYNIFMRLFDKWVPFERRSLKRGEEGITWISEQLDVVPCSEAYLGGPTAPTLIPDPPLTCDPIPGYENVPWIVNRDKRCNKKKWKIFLRTIISGVTGGSVISTTIYYTLRGSFKKTSPDLAEDQLATGRMQDNGEDAILFAH